MNPQVRFGDRAEAYAAHRPGYPPAVFDALFEGLDATSLRVADLGAGTGISSSHLGQRVAQVIAVEPNAAMRERAQPVPNVLWREGSGEQTGLPDQSVDVAAAFQSFHWFDAQRAFDECKRIAAQRIGMVQYERDETRPFGAAYGELIRPYLLDDTEGRRLRALDRFARLAGRGLRAAQIPWTQRVDLAGFIGGIDSSSYLPKSGAKADELRARARNLFAGHETNGCADLPRIYFVQYTACA